MNRKKGPHTLQKHLEIITRNNQFRTPYSPGNGWEDSGLASTEVAGPGFVTHWYVESDSGRLLRDIRAVPDYLKPGTADQSKKITWMRTSET